MGPEDQHPWDAQDEEIRQAFAAKDAEIERLQQKIKEQEDYIRVLKRNARGVTGQ